MTPVFFSFMVITKMNFHFHFRRISDFSYISQDSFSKKKKKNLILSFFINMSKRIVPLKKRKAQGLVSQVSSQVPQDSSQSSSQVPQGSSQSSSQVLQGSSQSSSQVPGSSQVSSKTFEKIISQNAKILQKLDILISYQKKIEERLEVPEINTEDLIKVIKSFSLYINYLYTN